MPSIELDEARTSLIVDLLAVVRALAAPSRQAILGYVVARPGRTVAITELAEAMASDGARLEQDARQLAAAGLIEQVYAVADTGPATSSVIGVAANPQSTERLAAMIGALATVAKAVAPLAPPPPRDERGQTLARFMRGGQLAGWPTQPRRRRFVLDAIVEQIPADRRLPEREIDVILKGVYPPDHCTIRRALVDAGLLARAEGLYWRPTIDATLPAKPV